MGVSKVELSNGETLVDLTKDTVTAETLGEGATAHNSKGEEIVGTMKSGGGGGSDVDYITDEEYESIMGGLGI